MMKNLLKLCAVLLASHATLASASVVNVLNSNGVFAGNSALNPTNVTQLDNNQMSNNLSDGNQATYFFGSNTGGTTTTAELTLSFEAPVYNQAGSDIAFYFVGDGVATKTNSMKICFGANCTLGGTTYDAAINTEYAINIGGTEVEWSVVTFDLSTFGFADDATLGLLTIDLIAGDYNRLSSIESLNTTSISAVPVPAAVWLFMTGLGALGFISRRRK